MSTEVLDNTQIKTFRGVAIHLMQYSQSLQPYLINRPVASTSQATPDMFSATSQFPVDPEWLEYVPKSQWKEIDGRPYCSIQHHPLVLKEMYSILLNLFTKEELNQLFKYLNENYDDYVELNFRALTLNKLTRVKRTDKGERMFKDGAIVMEEIGQSINVNSLTFHLRLLIECIGDRVNDQHFESNSAITVIFAQKIKLLSLLISRHRRPDEIKLLEDFFQDKIDNLTIKGCEDFTDALNNILTTIAGKIDFIPTLLNLKGSY